MSSSIVDQNMIMRIDGKSYSKKYYTKPELTHREVFTRSSMPKSLFEQVKAHRE